MAATATASASSAERTPRRVGRGTSTSRGGGHTPSHAPTISRRDARGPMLAPVHRRKSRMRERRLPGGRGADLQPIGPAGRVARQPIEGGDYPVDGPVPPLQGDRSVNVLRPESQTCQACWVALHDSIIRHVLRNNGAGADDGAVADLHAGEDACTVTDPHVVSEGCLAGGAGIPPAFPELGSPRAQPGGWVGGGPAG